MAKVRATQGVLGLLHQKLAEVMLEALDGESFEDPETGQVTVFKANNPALFTAIAKFLKDNDIVAIPETAGAMDALREQLKHKASSSLGSTTEGSIPWQNERTLN